MEFSVPKYRRDPNEKIEAVYSGVTHGNRTVTTIVRPSLDRNRMEATRVYGPALARGEGGRVAVLVLGGMETTLDEMEYILEAKREKKFVPRRNQGEIAQMCRLLQNRRNEAIEAARRRLAANSVTETPRKKKKVLHLPVGYRMVQTSEPGLRVLAKV